MVRRSMRIAYNNHKKWINNEYKKLTNQNTNQSVSEFIKIQRKLEEQLNFSEEHLKKLEFDHKNYRNNIENSRIWKFVRFFDKLFGKN